MARLLSRVELHRLEDYTWKQTVHVHRVELEQTVDTRNFRVNPQQIPLHLFALRDRVIDQLYADYDTKSFRHQRPLWILEKPMLRKGIPLCHQLKVRFVMYQELIRRCNAKMHRTKEP